MLQQVHTEQLENIRFASNGGNALKQLHQQLQRDLRHSKKSGRLQEYRSICTDLDDVEDMS